jgi:LPS O-antigen subunit length determinant protein (WzzB/FepE family)
MPSEALRNIRTVRQVNTSLEVSDRRRPRTTNSLSKTAEETAHLESLGDRRLEQVLARERQRSAALEASVEKSRRRLLRSREKLAVTINRNRALTALRHELQRARWAGTSAALVTSGTPAKKGRMVDIDY